MKHAISVSGFSYALRPVEIEDAAFIVRIRTEGADRNKYMHAVSSDVSLQKEWIKEYFNRLGDYYFIVENILSGKPEGLISIYDVDNTSKVAEWGRWILAPESLAATESVYLVYRVAFEVLGLESVYSRTIKNNDAVVSFHDSLGAANEGVLVNEFEIEKKWYDAVKHVVDKDMWSERISGKLEKISRMVYERTLKQELSKIEFHHIGIATCGIEGEKKFYQMLGYTQEGHVFEDALQGIRGMFIIAKNQPRLELLENLPEHHTLDIWLDKGIKYYHFAYLVDDIDKSMLLYTKKFKGKIISPRKPSVAFGLRDICFIMFSNRLIIELIQR